MRPLAGLAMLLIVGSAHAGELATALQVKCTNGLQQKLPVSTAETICTCITDKLFAQFSVSDIQSAKQEDVDWVVKHFYDQCSIRFNYLGR
jgi:hypothetical protein